MAADEELPLPFAAHLLVPFQIAWRNTPSLLPTAQRAQLASEQMSAWGLRLGAPEIVAAHDTLAEVLRLDEAWQTADATPLVPPETACCLCGSGLQTQATGAMVAVWSTSGHPTEVKEFRKKCPACRTVHYYSCVAAPRLWALVYVAHATKLREADSVALATALQSLGVGVTYVTRDATGAVLTLVRGFDHPKQHFHDHASAQRFVADALPSLPGIGDAFGRHQTGRVLRYRTTVLELPVFVRLVHIPPTGRQTRDGLRDGVQLWQLLGLLLHRAMPILPTRAGAARRSSCAQGPHLGAGSACL